MSLAYAVRQILVSPERTVLQELDCQRCGIGVRHNMIILAVNDQHRHFDGIQVLGKVGFRKRLEPYITSLDAHHHHMPPPIVDQAFRNVRLRPGKTIAWYTRYTE